MPEHEGGESRTVTAFILGFFVGVLMTLGGSGTYLVIYQGRARAEAVEARMAAEAARREAEKQRARAEEHLSSDVKWNRQAEKELKKAEK